MSTISEYAGKENQNNGTSKIIYLHPKGIVKELSIVIVGTHSDCKKLEKSMADVNSSEDWNYNYKTTLLENIDSIADRERGPEGMHADYIVYLVDVKNPNCLDQIRESIFFLDTVFLCGRIVLINTNHKLPTEFWSIDLKALPLLCEEFNLNLINGELNTDRDANHTAKRLLILASTVCGLKTGFPCMVDFPYHVHDQIL